MSVYLPPPDAVPQVSSPYPTVTSRVSAGKAWLLSLLIPGAGQMYCDASVRGFVTLVAFLIGLVVFVVIETQVSFVGLRLMLMLYAFAGLDAYLTARERNAGIDEDADHNPRVAAVLNLTTNGFGYLYLGSKAGLAIILGMAVLWRITNATVPLLGEMFAFGFAVHGWSMAMRKREESYPRAMRPAEESALPMAIPIAVAMIIIGGYYAFSTIGQIALWMGIEAE